MKQILSNHIKNIRGWQTKRKLVIFSVDDYGNIRIDSRAALNNLKNKKINFNSHFDTFDSLETREDLESLFEVLTSVNDKNGNTAVFTPYSLSCNIDFDAMASTGYQQYFYEMLPETFRKLTQRDYKTYNGTWSLWQEGIERGFMRPQFHGREHLNLAIFNDLLSKGNENLKSVLIQNSYVSIPEHKNYKNSWTAAYSFDQIKETKDYLENVEDGLKKFRLVYGIDASAFTPPSQQFPLHLEGKLFELGLKYIDRPRKLRRHLGNGEYRLEKHKLGDGNDLIEIVRNVSFEPTTKRNADWVNFAFNQIEAAFLWNKPANISSHRVNFCGHIDENNRKVGLRALKQLLDKIVKAWPEVEFISADQLGNLISKEK